MMYLLDLVNTYWGFYEKIAIEMELLAEDSRTILNLLTEIACHWNVTGMSTGMSLLTEIACHWNVTGMSADLGCTDWRDLLMCAGFGDLYTHMSWTPE